MTPSSGAPDARAQLAAMIFAVLLLVAAAALLLVRAETRDTAIG